MRTVITLLFVAAAGAPLMAHQQAAPPAGLPTIQRPGATPSQGQAPPPPSIPPPSIQTPRPAPPAPPGVAQGQAPAGSWQNIKLEVGIADSVNADTSARKTVTLTIADGRNGQVRSMGGADGLINIDARPSLHRDGRIFLQLTMEYKPEFQQQVGQQTNPNARLTTFSESLAVMLQDGVPLIASESSDPRSDRKVTITLRATVQK